MGKAIGNSSVGGYGSCFKFHQSKTLRVRSARNSNRCRKQAGRAEPPDSWLQREVVAAVGAVSSRATPAVAGCRCVPPSVSLPSKRAQHSEDSIFVLRKSHKNQIESENCYY